MTTDATPKIAVPAVTTAKPSTSIAGTGAWTQKWRWSAGSSMTITVVRESRNDVVVDRLQSHVARLVEQRVLSASQAQELVDAARADRLDGQSDAAQPAAAQPAAAQPAPRSMSSAVLEVLGYVGGALVLGAVIMLGSFFWDDLGSTGRKLVAVASLLVPALGGAALIKGRVRPELGAILLALACYAAGFAYLVVFEDQEFVVSAAVVVLTSGIGAVLLRSGAFLVSGWSGGMLLACAIVFNLIDTPIGADPAREAAYLALGFLLVALALAASGVLLSRTLAWSLAGLSGWAASIALQGAPNGEWLSLLAATVVSSGLLTVFVQTHRYVFAVIGCAILLSMWPVSLYRILDDAVGAAIGLIAAGAVLIATVIWLSRRRRISGIA
jgi:Predicted membrane protein (DUF2157)